MTKLWSATEYIAINVTCVTPNSLPVIYIRQTTVTKSWLQKCIFVIYSLKIITSENVKSFYKAFWDDIKGKNSKDVTTNR